MLKLVLPQKKHKVAVEIFKQKMLLAGSKMYGTGALKTMNFEEWQALASDNQKGKNLPEGFVPASQFICLNEEGEVFGLLHLRHSLTEDLLNFGGHIGYSIAPDQRGKGLCKQMLALGLRKAEKLGIEKVMISCAEDNLPSKKCIISCGGVLEDVRFWPEGNVFLERYWINLKK